VADGGANDAAVAHRRGLLVIANRARATEHATRDRRWLPRGRARFALLEKRGALRRRNAAEQHNA